MSVHDSQTSEKLLTEKDRGQSVYADSAYIGSAEYIFDFIENSMNDSFVRTIGIIRVKAKLGILF